MTEDSKRTRRDALLREWLPVTALYSLLGAILTWPLVVRMSSGIYGFGNDNWGGIWFGHWIHEAFWGPAKTSFSKEIQFPFGFEFDDRYIQPYDRLIDIVFGGIADGLFAYNLMVFLSFPLAGLAMYALARHVTGSRPAAVVAGTIFAISPFHLAMAMQYPPMASIHVAPLLVLALIVALQRRRLRDAAWFGAAMAFVWVTSYYYGWFAIFFVAAAIFTYALLALIRAIRARRARAGVAEGARFAVTRGPVAIGTFAVLAIPPLLPLINKVLEDQTKFARAEADLAYTSVRPWQYVLPAHDSLILGSLTREDIQTHLGILPVYEQNVYIGIFAGLLALAGIVAGRRVIAAGLRRLGVPLLAAAGFAVLLTLGPAIPYEVTSIGDWLSPGTNPHFTGPVAYIYDLSPNFRYYGRAFVFVSVVIALFAAVGLAWLLRNRSPRASWVVAGVVTLLVFADFANVPPSRFVDLSTPAWVKAVEKLPEDAAIVEYPVADYSSPRSLQYVYWQTRHDRPTVNPPETPKSQAFHRSIDDPDSFLAGRELSRAGVDFAVIHTDLDSPTYPPYQPLTPSDELPPDAGAENPWFELHSRSSDAVIYKVLDEPKRIDGAVVAYGAGWGALEIDPTGRWRWQLNPDSALSVFAAKDYEDARLVFDVTSFNVPRDMVMRLDGREILRTKVPADRSRKMRVPVDLREGLQKLEVLTDPPPAVVDQILHNGDLRALSIRLREPRIELPRGGR